MLCSQGHELTLKSKLSHIANRVRFLSQHFWAAAVVFLLGLISTYLLLWVYLQTAHHASAHVPLMLETNRVSLLVSRSHVMLEQLAGGDSNIQPEEIIAGLSESVILSERLLAIIERDESLGDCPLHDRYLLMMQQADSLVKLFVEVARQRIDDNSSGFIASQLELRTGRLCDALVATTNELENLLLDEVNRRKNNLLVILLGVIGFWAILVTAVFVVSTNKEKHRNKVLDDLRRAEEKVRTFISTADDMIYYQWPDGSVSDLNRAVNKVTGYSAKEFQKNPRLWCEILHPEDLELAEEFFRKCPRGQSSFDFQYRLQTKAGLWRWIQSKRVVVRGDDGCFAGYNCIDRDITELKESAESLVARTEELKERVKEQQCLYGVAQVLRDSSLTLDVAFRRVLEHVQLAWKHPEVCRARITVRGREYVLAPFEASPWVQRADIFDAHEKVGCIEVCYLSQMPAESEGPFLFEERELIDALARQIGNHIARRQTEETLVRNNAFLNSVLDSLTYPFYVLDASDFTIQVANRASGANPSERSITCYELSHGRTSPCTSTEHPCPLQRVKEERKPCVVEHVHLDRNGNERYHEVHGYPVFDDEGKVVQVIEYMLDITDRKQAEYDLGRLAAFPANNPNVVMSLSPEAEVLYINKAAEHRLGEIGLGREDAIKCLPVNIRDIIQQCLLSGTGVLNILNEIAGRTWTWSFHPVEGQNVIHCYATDITELMRQEKEVRMLSAAVNQSSNMVCITDVNGIVEYVNPFFTKVTGYSLVDIVGRPVSILKSGDYDEELYRDLWQTITSGKTWSGIIKNKRHDSELYFERKTITPIYDDNGKIMNFLSVSSDITNELKTQQKLIQSDKLSAIGTLAAGVAHEFKNYLGGIIGNASFALHELESDDGRQLAGETLSKIIEMGEKANDVAMSLLTYSKARPEEKQPEDLRKLIRRSAKLVEKELRNQSIELVTYFEEVPPVEVSASKIQQLLLNLLINAQHAIKQHGVITIAVFSRRDAVEVRVADTGVGIPRENLEKIFDPFFSTKGVWGKDELIGTGMGLSICRNIAREYRGELTVNSVVGIGTTFTLTLPVTNVERQHVTFRATPEDELQALVFSLDKSILTHYHNQACQLNARLLAADDISTIPEDPGSIADIVICDSRFIGKLELLKMVERCRDSLVPYVMVNCGASEYELAGLHDGSVANFKELPDFERIIAMLPPDTLEKSKARHA
ncbi:MAG: PAS domain S-box protein [Candidatus Zixiibacteriota bacterium]